MTLVIGNRDSTFLYQLAHIVLLNDQAAARSAVL